MVRRPFLFLTLGLAACEDCREFGPPSAVANDAGPACNASAEDGVSTPHVSMNFANVTVENFFAAPFPGLGRPVNGTDADRFPADTAMLVRMRSLVSRDGYALSAGIFFALDGPTMAGTLPPLFTAPNATGPALGVVVFPLLDPTHLAPVNVHANSVLYRATQSSPSQQTYLLSAIPVQGVPLHESSDYVALVTNAVATPAPDAGAAPFCGDLASATGIVDPNILAKYQSALADLPALGLACGDVSAMTVFHTTDPTAKMHAVADLAKNDFRANRSCPISLRRDEDPSGLYDRCPQAPYCIYTGSVIVPDYQQGTPPYMPYFDWGGGWPEAEPVPSRTADHNACIDGGGGGGKPWTPTWRSARVVVTIPKALPPPSGYPIMVLVRTGAGTKTDPLVDRGPFLGSDPSACTETQCRGPAEVLQAVGWAGITIDGPLVGLSRTEPIELDEDLGIFDVLNPEALRDNLRQSAVELTLIPEMIDQGLLQVPLGDCDPSWTGQMAKFDKEHIAIFSHSMGSSVSPLALATEPRFGAAIMSGSGGSMLENALYKTKPLPVNAAGSLYGYMDNCSPKESDMQASLFQWSLEAADSQVYARRMIVDPLPPYATWSSPDNARSVLMIQGLVDHYILPPIADTMTLGEGLDLGLGHGSCNHDPTCDLQPVNGQIATPTYPGIASLLALSGRHAVELTDATGNYALPSRERPYAPSMPPLTAVVVQHRIDENREYAGSQCAVDGHEVIYESTLARHQYACFLHDFALDRVPAVRELGEEFDPCD